MTQENENREEKEIIFPQKYMKKLQSLATGFTDTVDSLDTEEIKKRILSSENNLYEIEHEKESNLKLMELKEKLKEINAPFAEAKGLETAKIKYCLFTLANRGVRV